MIAIAGPISKARHKYMPSWESEGQVGADILIQPMGSHVVCEDDARRMAKATDDFVGRWFPGRLLGASSFEYMGVRRKKREGGVFTRSQVLAVKRHYRYMVGVTVDKGPGRLLHCCPEFYETTLYNPTFPVRNDTVRYRPTGVRDTTVLANKRALFLRKQWQKLAV